MLLSGEPGIGKSRLAYTLREHVTSEGSLLLEARCSPYHQHSALYPLIEVLQRTLLFTRQDTNDEKGQPEEGLTVLAEASALMQRTGERWYEAELFRLKGKLTLAKSSVPGLEATVQKEAEECFL